MTYFIISKNNPLCATKSYDIFEDDAVVAIRLESILGRVFPDLFQQPLTPIAVVKFVYSFELLHALVCDRFVVVHVIFVEEKS